MIRVLHYIPGFLMGGIETLFLSWYKHLDRNNFEFELLLRTKEEGDALRLYVAMGGRLSENLP